MKDRIEKKFAELKEAGKKAFVGYLTAGDPDIEQSEKDIRTALDNGVDILELGIPFSDPTADGPTIQEASQRALAGGMNITKALQLVKRIRADYDNPIILFGYANPFLKYGYERICRDADQAGADGFLIVDLPFEEAEEIKQHMRPLGLAFISLTAPTTPVERAKVILADAEGFVYYIMVKGVTGARTEIPANVKEHVDALKSCTDIPIAAGFGVSNGEQASVAATAADGVVVGSALIAAARRNELEALVKDISGAL